MGDAFDRTDLDGPTSLLRMYCFVLLQKNHGPPARAASLFNGVSSSNMTEQENTGVSLGPLLISTLLLFAALELVGEVWDGGQINNAYCFHLLGCNAGFFGYDAVMHFVSGILEVSFFLWLARRSVSWNLFKGGFWQNVLIMVALVALVSVSWEILEFGYDSFRVDILHHNLLLPTNHYTQPSNADTVGDLLAGLLGGITTLVFLKISRHKMF